MNNTEKQKNRRLQSGIMQLMAGILMAVAAIAAVLNTNTLASVFCGLAALIGLAGGISNLIAYYTQRESPPGR